MFDEKQEKLVFQIISLFKDENFKEKRLAIYNNKPEMLNPFEMYVIEEINRIGNNNYFNTLINLKEENVIEKYNTFMKRCNEDFVFELQKVKDYYKNNLSEFEKFCISIILKNKEKKELLNKLVMYKYDDLYELKYSTDKEIKETIANIALGISIDILLAGSDTAKSIKERQLKPGMFADVDKEYLINEFRKDEIAEEIISFSVSQIYPMVKTLVSAGYNEQAYNRAFGFSVSKYITNIKITDIIKEDIKSK